MSARTAIKYKKTDASGGVLKGKKKTLTGSTGGINPFLKNTKLSNPAVNPDAWKLPPDYSKEREQQDPLLKKRRKFLDSMDEEPQKITKSKSEFDVHVRSLKKGGVKGRSPPKATRLMMGIK